MKTIICIRHGTALHNVLFEKIGLNAYSDYRDTPLVHMGVLESKKLGETWKDKSKIDLVVLSPTSRTLDTTTNIFLSHYKQNNIPMIALDCLVEYPCSDNCNKRQDLDILTENYKHIDFSQIKDHTYIEKDKEELPDLKKRISEFKKWILGRKEKNIAMVGHSSYIKSLMDMDIGDETNELKHCYPYKVEIN